MSYISYTYGLIVFPYPHFPILHLFIEVTYLERSLQIACIICASLIILSFLYFTYKSRIWRDRLMSFKDFLWFIISIILFTCFSCTWCSLRSVSDLVSNSILCLLLIFSMILYAFINIRVHRFPFDCFVAFFPIFKVFV